jgi:hypothetical protein
MDAASTSILISAAIAAAFGFLCLLAGGQARAGKSAELAEYLRARDDLRKRRIQLLRTRREGAARMRGRLQGSPGAETGISAAAAGPAPKASAAPPAAAPSSGEGLPPSEAARLSRQVKAEPQAAASALKTLLKRSA